MGRENTFCGECTDFSFLFLSSSWVLRLFCFRGEECEEGYLLSRSFL